MGAKLLAAVALAALFACDRAEKTEHAPGPAAAATPTITDRDWALVALGDKSDPIGTGGKPLTLRLDPATSRANGFAGCNSFGGSFELDGEKLKFGPMISTKMFCESSQEIEDAYLAALAAVASWQLKDGTLILRGAQGPVLRFRAAAP
jgi:heat shock protein HslJ